jgi:WD40 repeat protein
VRVYRVEIGPDGKTLLTAALSAQGKQGSLRLWDFATGEPIGEPWDNESVGVAAFSPDGKTLLVARDKEPLTARLIDVPTARQVGDELPFRSPVIGAVFRSDSKSVLLLTADGEARLLSTETAQLVPFEGDRGRWTVGLDGTVLHTADGRTRLIDGGTGEAAGEAFPGQAAPLASLQFALNPADRTVLADLADGTVRLWRLPPPAAVIRQPAGMMIAAGFTADGRGLPTANPAAEVYRLDAATGKALGEPWTIRPGGLARAFSPDAKTAWVTHEREALFGSDWVRLWDVTARKPIGPRLPHAAYFGFSPDGGVAFAHVGGEKEDETHLLDAATGKALGRPLRHPNGPYFTSVAVAPGGKAVLTGHADGSLRLWDAETGDAELLADRHERGEQTWRVGGAFAPDGRTFAVTDPGGVGVRLWDAARRKPLAEPLRHPGEVRSVTFSPDGKVLLCVAKDEAHFWDVATGKRLGPSRRPPHALHVMSAAFSPDGRKYVLGGSTGCALVGDAPAPLEGDPERLRLWAEVSTGSELDAGGAVVELGAKAWRERWKRLQKLGGPP